MPSTEAVIVSYRLGGTDGVAVEAAKWEWALRQLGFDTRRVAGEIDGLRPDDTWLPFLAIDPIDRAAPDQPALAAAIAGADLVVVENVCSLPLNPVAAKAARDVVERHRGRVCFHHHDFAWERPHLAHITGFPPARSDSLHITISRYAQRQLHERHIEAFCIHNSFDFDREPGERDATREELGFDPNDVVLLQPTRAIPRKNVAGALRFAAAVAGHIRERRVVFWITGPAEDGYDEEFAALIAGADVPVHVGRTQRADDAYAAADLVVFPSTWEGFGNPVIEATAARRMVAVGSYPVLEELTDTLEILSIDDPGGAATWLANPDPLRLEHNHAQARARFALEHLPGRLAEAFSKVGWHRW